MKGYNILVGKPEGKKPLRELSIYENIILKLISKKYIGDGGRGVDWFHLGHKSDQ
jgi:hypothetical protein